MLVEPDRTPTSRTGSESSTRITQSRKNPVPRPRSVCYLDRVEELFSASFFKAAGRRIRQPFLDTSCSGKSTPQLRRYDGGWEGMIR